MQIRELHFYLPMPLVLFNNINFNIIYYQEILHNESWTSFGTFEYLAQQKFTLNFGGDCFAIPWIAIVMQKEYPF